MDVIRFVINLWLASGVTRSPNIGPHVSGIAPANSGRVSTKTTDRKTAQRLAEEYESAVRTKRTLRQAQLVLDRLHEEMSGQVV